MAEADFIFKIVLIGPINAGKSSLVARYCDNIFNDSYLSTIGVDFKIKTVNINGKLIKMQIWDTAGQERFQSLTNQQFKGCHAVICVFDLTDPLNFQKSVIALEQAILQHNLNIGTIMLVGNKQDLHRQVKEEKIEEICNKLSIEHIEVSAKEDTNINLLFQKISEKIFSLVDKSQLIAPKKKNIDLTQVQRIENKSKCC